MTLGFVVRWIVLVLAGHAVVSTLAALATRGLWRGGAGHPLDSAIRSADRLFVLRMAPTLVSMAVAWAGVTVAYLLWEPRGGTERAGPVALALAGVGAALVASAVWRAGQAVRESARIGRRLRSAATSRTLPLPVRAVIIDAAFPIVTVAGVLASRLFVARAVVDACSPEELRAIVAHEHAHAAARDNLRRLALRAAPDVLWWFRHGREMERDWAAAAELAADEAAGRDSTARLHLASALVKVARLGSAPAAPLPASALYRGEPITERVRRLVEPPNDTAAPRAVWPERLALAALAGATPLWMPAVFAAAEALLKLGAS